MITWSCKLHRYQPAFSRTHLPLWFLFFCLLLDGPATKTKEIRSLRDNLGILVSCYPGSLAWLSSSTLSASLLLASRRSILQTLVQLRLTMFCSSLHGFHLQPGLCQGRLVSFRFLGGGSQIVLLGAVIKSTRPWDPSMSGLLLLTAAVS